MSQRSIAVLTGGGDCPGLNPAIKGLCLKAIASGYKVLGIPEGWRGLVETIEPILLSESIVHHIDRLGGTMLASSRTNPFKITGGPAIVQTRMKSLGIEALVAIGGEDTLGVAARLHQELNLKIVGIPKTIDGDLSATDYCLGLESAIEVITHSIDILRSTADSHQRIFVVEVMGRHAGHLALKGGISAGADIILIPEEPFDMNKLAEIILSKKRAGQRYSIVVVAEGASAKGNDLSLSSEKTDAFGHVRLGGIGNFIAEKIEKLCGLDCRAVVLSHLQRGGSPSAYDRRMGHYFGIAACEAIQSGYFGKMVALKAGKIELVPLLEAIKELHLVDTKKLYDKEYYCARLQVML